MPRGVRKAKAGTSVEFVKSVEQKLQGLHDDFKTAYTKGFEDGANAERKRLAGVLMGGGSVSSPKSTVESAPVENTGVTTAEPKTKKPRKNPWAAYTPEQREARLAILADARSKRKPKAGTESSEAIELAPVSVTCEVSEATAEAVA